MYECSAMNGEPFYDLIVCNREAGPDGIHRDDAAGVWWFPDAPALETIELPAS